MTNKVDNVLEYFVNKVPVKTLIFIDKNGPTYGAEICEELGVTTYSHSNRTIKTLEKHGMVKGRVDGRKRLLETTGYGSDLAESFEQVLGDL